MRGLICGLLLASCGTGMAWCFVMIWMEGVVKVCEPVLWIRLVELMMAVAMATYGLCYFIEHLRKCMRRYNR